MCIFDKGENRSRHMIRGEPFIRITQISIPTRRVPGLQGVHMPSIEERLDQIEAYLHKRYLYLKEKPRTSFEEMELLKEFGFDEPPEP